jgi:putative FmdB family regulatory protein
MPIYEYECGACGENHEFIQKFSEGPKRKCPSCGALKLKKQISAAAFHLKGTGWYVTDFRDGGKGKKEGESKDAESKDSGASESKSSDTETPKSDDKSSSTKDKPKAKPKSSKGSGPKAAPANT